MRADGYGMKRMSRETRLGYNTVKKYLKRMDAEASEGGGAHARAGWGRRAPEAGGYNGGMADREGETEREDPAPGLGGHPLDDRKPAAEPRRQGRAAVGRDGAPPEPRGTDATRADGLLESVRRDLLPGLRIESSAPHRDPVVVRRVPAPWELLGRGNYAAVLCHPGHPDRVAKVYAPGRPGLAEEAEVYRRLGAHPAFSECLHAGEGFLVLRRLHGTTIYDCMRLGLRIPERAVEDVDEALEYARGRGLYPHDVHSRNVMVQGGRGLVVDVSDFLDEDACPAWDDLKKVYYRLYKPFLSPLGLRVPHSVLNAVRKLYRRFRRSVPRSS